MTTTNLNIEQTVIDNDSFSIIKNMVEKWEDDEKDYLYTITYTKFDKVLDHLEYYIGEAAYSHYNLTSKSILDRINWEKPMKLDYGVDDW